MNRPEPIGRLAAALAGLYVIVALYVLGTGLFVAFPGDVLSGLSYSTPIGLVIMAGGPIIGGVLAGYLRGSETMEGLITGAVAALLAGIPYGIINFYTLSIAFRISDFETDLQYAAGVGVIIALSVALFILGGLFATVCGAIGSTICDRREPPVAESHSQDGDPDKAEPVGRVIAILAGICLGFATSSIFIIIPLIGLFLSPLGLPAGGFLAGFFRGNATREGMVTGGLVGFLPAIPLTGFLAFKYFSLDLASFDVQYSIIIGLITVICFSIVSFFTLSAAVGGAVGAEFSNRRAPS